MENGRTWKHHQVLTNAWKSMDEVVLALQFMLRAGATREKAKKRVE